MDFFARQDQARRSTGLLVLYFFIAVILIVLAVNAVVYFFIAYFANAQISSIPMDNRLDDSVWFYITLFTVGLIASGSLFRFIALAGGGSAVAEMTSARLVQPGSHNADEQRYVNVVEEMSIAAGVPMPTLYVMDDEPGINAFVAGYKPTEAVMVVTQGTLQELDRDQLQGVVGHEFSHILNGDMRINVRLIAILAGILLIGKIGELLMRGSGRSSRGKNTGMVLGLALFAVGYIGLFFGRLIKAAISRQREFLADASSVQFTRNPLGIAGALFKIKQSVNAALLNNSHAEDMSHMCFGETMRFGFAGLLATHPPLDVRINAVAPGFLKSRQSASAEATQEPVVADETAMGFAGSEGIAASADQLTQSVGNPTPEHLAYAASLHARFDSAMLDLVHTAQGAQVLIFALLVQNMERQLAMEFLQQQISADMNAMIAEQATVMSQLDRKLRLPLLDLAVPSLKQLDEHAVEKFLNVIESLIKLDKKFTLQEFVLLTLLQQRLSPRAARVEAVRFYSFKALQPEIQLLLSILAQCSGQAAEKVSAAFQRNIKTFNSAAMTLIPASGINVSKVNAALKRLNQMPAMLKRSFLISCADLVIDDGIIMPSEVELLRAIAESLDCPMPPLLPQ